MKNTPIKNSISFLFKNISICLFILIISVIIMKLSEILGYIVNLFLIIGLLSLISKNHEKNSLRDYFRELSNFFSNFQILIKSILSIIIVILIFAVAVIIVTLISMLIYMLGYPTSGIVFSTIVVTILYFIIFLRYYSVLAVIIYTKCDLFDSFTIITIKYFSTNSKTIK